MLRYLCGAACAGISADLVGDVGLAMQAGGAVFLGATTWFGFKSAGLNKLYKRYQNGGKTKVLVIYI